MLCERGTLINGYIAEHKNLRYYRSCLLHLPIGGLKPGPVSGFFSSWLADGPDGGLIGASLSARINRRRATRLLTGLDENRYTRGLSEYFPGCILAAPDVSLVFGPMHGFVNLLVRGVNGPVQQGSRQLFA